MRLEVEGVDPPPGANDHRIDYSAIDDDFLAAAGIELVAGRGFEAADVPDGEPVGRPMDFLIQEIGREFNTIGSKANDAAIAQHVVQSKTELEKVREQVQNIE